MWDVATAYDCRVGEGVEGLVRDSVRGDVRFRGLISSRRPASQRRFSEGRFITPLSCSFPKTSSDEKRRRTTGQVAENGVVDDATDACSLRRIFATFLADSSTSRRRNFVHGPKHLSCV